MSLNCSSRSKTSYRETFLTLAHLNNFRFLFLHNILGILLSQSSTQKWFISKLLSPLGYKLLHSYTYSGTMTDKKFCWKFWTNFGRRISTEKEHEFAGGVWRSWITDLLQYMCVCVCVYIYIYIYIFFAFETFTTSVKSKHPASEPELSPSSRRAQHKHFVHLSVTHAQHTARHIVCHHKYFLSGKMQR